MDRIGFATGYDPNASVPQMTEWMKAAELRGYEMGFFSETNNLMRDGVSAMSAFGMETEDIRLGFTQVVRLRSPVTMAQTLATLDELTDERVVLAPGACATPQARTHSLEDVDPPGTLTEWVTVMGKILSGEKIDYDGKYIQLDGVGLGWMPVREEIPFWIAATSQTGLRLAGRVGDGVLLNTVSSPKYSENAIQIVREAVKEAGRDWDSFTVAQLINASVEDEKEEALDAVRWEVASKFRPPFHQFGLRKRVGEPIISKSVLPALETAYEQNGDQGVIEELPTSWVDSLTASGPPEEVRSRIQAYVDAGVDLPIVRPAKSRQTYELLDTFAD